MRKPNRRLPKPAIGWPLLPVPDGHGSIAWPDLEVSVRQMIRVILMTRRQELLLVPRFGVGLGEFLHAPNTLTTRRRIHDAIIAGLADWEPRIVVDRVDVEPDAERADRLNIRIAYRLKRSSQPVVLSLAMMLEA